jgi:hypothetical protein
VFLVAEHHFAFGFGGECAFLFLRGSVAILALLCCVKVEGVLVDVAFCGEDSFVSGWFDGGNVVFDMFGPVADDVLDGREAVVLELFVFRIFLLGF